MHANTAQCLLRAAPFIARRRSRRHGAESWLAHLGSDDMHNRSDAIANLALATLCLTATYAIADRYIFTHATQLESASGYRVGDPLTSAPEQIGLRRARVSAIVVVSNNCQYCAASAPFYRRLAQFTKDRLDPAFQMLFLGTGGSADASAFVAANGLEAELVRPTPSDVSSRIQGTPTLLVVDDEGRVTSTWVGQLSNTDETSVLSAISERLKQH